MTKAEENEMRLLDYEAQLSELFHGAVLAGFRPGIRDLGSELTRVLGARIKTVQDHVTAALDG